MREASKLLKGTDSIVWVPDTQKQVIVATQEPKVLFGAPESPTTGVAGLDDKIAVGEFGKTLMTEVITGE